MYKGYKRYICNHGNDNKTDPWDRDMPGKSFRKTKRSIARITRRRNNRFINSGQVE